MRIAVADIGGTAIKAGIWNGKEISDFREIDTLAYEGGLKITKRVIDLFKEYGDFDAVGISTAGQVDITDGSIYYANENLPNYTGLKVKDIFENEFNVPVFVDNDVNCAAYGELNFGAAQGLSDFLCLTYGTGVGGAIVIDGKIYYGSTFGGGSFGGIVTHPEMIDGTDFSGCYENFASVSALDRNVSAIFPELNSGRRVFDAFGHPEVRKIIDSWIDEVSFGLITLIHIFNPSDIVLGGGVMAQPYIIEKLTDIIAKNVSSQWNGVALHQAKLGNLAGLIGAASMAENSLKTVENDG